LRACGRAWFRARVHGFVRAYMVACALMCLRVCVCACLRAYDLLDLQNYTETQRGTYYFYRTLTAASTVRQDKTTSFPYARARLRPCFARTQLRARLHGFVRACMVACARVFVRLSKFCVRTHGTVPTFIIEQIAVALCNIFYFLFQPSTVTYSLYGTFLYTMLLLRTPCIVLSLCKTFS
jgi:hypothetical protein